MVYQNPCIYTYCNYNNIFNKHIKKKCASVKKEFLKLKHCKENGKSDQNVRITKSK